PRRRPSASSVLSEPCPQTSCGSQHPLGTRVPLFGGVLLRAPPGLVGAVPVDGRGQPGREVPVDRLPPQLLPQPTCVDRVPPVVAGPVGHVVEVVPVAPH